MAYKSFEQYLAEWDAEARPFGEPKDRCDGCGGPDPITRDALCRACVRYHQGYDEAEEKLLNSLLGGAVAGALDAGVSPELVTVAVQRAIRKHTDEATDAAIKGFLRAAEGSR